MKTKILISGIFLIMVAVIMGGVFYGDRQLREAYNNMPDKRFELDNNLNMGLFAGSNAWNMVFTYDLCYDIRNPDNLYATYLPRIKFYGEDKISRAWTGYDITTQLYFVTEAKNKKIPLGTIQTHLSYLGKVDSTFYLPEEQHDFDEQAQLYWDNIKIDFSGSLKNGALRWQNISLDIPELDITENNNMSFKVRKLKTKIQFDDDFEYTIPKLVETSINKISYKHSNVFLSAEMLKNTNKLHLTENSLQHETNGTINNLNVFDGQLTNVRWNMNAQSPDFNPNILRQWFKIWSRKSQECVQDDEMQKADFELEDALFDSGWKISLKDSGLSLYDGHFQADINSEIPKDVSSLLKKESEIAAHLLPFKTGYRFVADKQFIRDFYTNVFVPFDERVYPQSISDEAFDELINDIKETITEVKETDTQLIWEKP